ncbi:MAG: ribosome maturation factor RimM [Bacteroidota bacterium]
MELIAIGKIAKPVGIRGELKIIPLTDDLNRFLNLRTVMTGTAAEQAVERLIVRVRISAQHIVAALEGVSSVEEAEVLRNDFVFIPEEQKKLPGKGRYLIDRIIGCAVAGEDGASIGILTDVLKLPANDVWVVRSGEKEFLIPAVKEFVESVDEERKRIVIHVIKGLLE